MPHRRVPNRGEAEIDHVDGCRTNNTLSNLEAVTHQENQRRASALGLYRKGVELPGSRLTERGVKEIRALRGVVSQRGLAQRLGVSQQTVGRAQREENWTHV